MPFIYILQCRDGSLYTGIAKDVARRLTEHNAGRASRYTRVRLPVRLVWSRRVRSWGLALREEYRIKHLPRAAKLALVRSAVRSARTERRARKMQSNRRAREGRKERPAGSTGSKIPFSE